MQYSGNYIEFKRDHRVVLDMCLTVGISINGIKCIFTLVLDQEQIF